MSMRSNRHAVMPGLLHSRNERFSFRKNHWFARIRAGEFFHRIHGIEAKQRDELHFVAIIANKQFRAAIAANLSSGYARKDFVAQHLFVRFGICGFRPAVPNPGDH